MELKNIRTSKPSFHLKTILATLTCFVFSTPAVSQVVPIETVAGYKIARVESSEVCFAVTNLRSTQNANIAFSYYHAKTGQRWQVGGYISSLIHPEPDDVLTITFDDDLKLTRPIEFSDGDFMVPFQALAELEAFERDVENSDMLIFGLKEDSIEIDLRKYRKAIAAVIKCVVNNQQ